MRRLLPLFLLICLLGAQSARAQSGARAELFGLDTTGFPTMTVSLDVYDASGVFVSSLTSDAVTILEDDQPRAIDALNEFQPGVQIVVAINPGSTFATRDANGVSRYAKISEVLFNWVSALLAEGADDLSLITTGGPNSAHLKNPRDWLDSFNTYQPQLRTATPSLDTFARALDAAADPTPQPGMKRIILFITPSPDWNTLSTLESLKARAVELRVRVYVWMITSQAYFTTSGATALQDLAAQTGGRVFAYSGDETIPSPEDYLIPLRHTYLLTYTSRLTASGSHSLSAQVMRNGETITSLPVTFDLDVQPPNPILVSPPQQIVRQSPKQNEFNLKHLAPAQQEIEMIVEFPDGHPRPLVRTRLYVNGQAVAENTAEPFDRFVWDLSNYTSSGQHTIAVEVEDSLGLSKMSTPATVTITVIQPPRGLQAFLARYSLWLAGGAVLLAGGILLFILLPAGKRRPPSTAARRRSRKLYMDPLTQPVPQQYEKTAARLPWTRRPKPAPAYLVRLKDDRQPATAPPISLTGSEITFGTDPVQATQVLDDPSVSPLHARLRQTEDGSFFLQDERSVAGTWVNYEPLKDARRLEHGDIIHFGQLSYRFMLRKPPERPKSRVEPAPKP